MSHAVAHVMRTYGVHGGEHQLAQLFRSFEVPEFQHLFFVVYRDDICQRYFSGISKLRTETLLNAAKQSGAQAEIRLQPGYDHSYYFIARFI